MSGYSMETRVISYTLQLTIIYTDYLPRTLPFNQYLALTRTHT